MNSPSVCFGGSVVTLSAVLFSLLGCASSTCPKPCSCPSSLRWICINVTLSDIAGLSGHPKTLRIVNLSHGMLLNASVSPFHSVRRLHVVNSTIRELSEDFVAAFPNVKRVKFLSCSFECSEKLLPLQTWEHVLREENLTCSTLDVSTRGNVFSALHEIKTALAQCPERCKCSIYAKHFGNPDLPNMLINCTNASLVNAPSKLPESLPVHLDLSFNQLTEVAHVFSSSAYRKVTVFNVSHNSIADFEVTHSGNVNHFYVFDLSFNKLTQLPKIFLGKRPPHENHLMLTGNPWKCDCQNREKFLSLGTQQAYTVPDYDYIICDDEGGERSVPTICPNSTAGAGWSVPYACLVETALAVLLVYYTNKIVRLCQSMYTGGEFHVAVHIFLQNTSHTASS